jgi:hypothetical protein
MSGALIRLIAISMAIGLVGVETVLRFEALQQNAISCMSHLIVETKV